MCFAGLMSGDAFALGSSEKFIQPYVATNLIYDSNILRVSENVKDSFIERVRAGFDLDWKLNRQHFLLKGEVNHSWYQDLDELNYLGWDTLAKWDWQLGNYLSGEIGYSNNQILGNFTQINGDVDGSGGLNNLINTQQFFANSGYLFHPNGKVHIGWFRTDTEYDADDRSFSNNIEDNAEFELQYLSPTGSNLGFRFLSTIGQYPDREFNQDSREDDGYLRFNYWLFWKWQLSVKTQIEGQVGYTTQENDHLRNRDFSDFTGRLTLNWAPTEKTQLLLSGWREIDQAYNFNANFILTQGVAFTPTWKITRKVELNLPLSYERLEFIGDPNTSSNGIQVDNIWSATLNALYLPFDNTTLGMLLRYEKKNSNGTANDGTSRSYETASVGLNMQVTF